MGGGIGLQDHGARVHQNDRVRNMSQKGIRHAGGLGVFRREAPRSQKRGPETTSRFADEDADEERNGGCREKPNVPSAA
jgi:hypothetical protein